MFITQVKPQPDHLQTSRFVVSPLSACGRRHRLPVRIFPCSFLRGVSCFMRDIDLILQIDGLVQGYSNSIANALQLLQSCT